VPFASHAEMATGVMRTLIVPRLAFQRQRFTGAATALFRLRRRTGRTSPRTLRFLAPPDQAEAAAATDSCLQTAAAFQGSADSHLVGPFKVATHW
jgi:hypothetical protein